MAVSLDAACDCLPAGKASDFVVPCLPCVSAGGVPVPSPGLTILDGGMGHQLKAMGIEISGPVGSQRHFLGVAVANTEQPDVVRDAHLAYIDAGADVVTTNSYACVPRCLALADDEDMKAEGSLERLVEAAGKCARAAVDARPDCKVAIAGSLPPLAESYRPDKVGPFEENLAHYRVIAKSIAKYSDLLLCETMSTVDEGRAACTAALETGLPVWVAWTLDETAPVLRSKESIEDAVKAVAELPGADTRLQGCLFNCTSPEIIVTAMPMLRKVVPSHVRIGAYANGFLTASSGCGEYRDLPESEYLDQFAAKWIESGATIVGGCCGVFPRHIKAIKEGVEACN